MNKSADPFLGKIIHGYRLEHLLGRGAMTVVYRARAQERRQTPELILTILLEPETLAGSAKRRFQDRFLQEAGQIEQLHHPNICPMYGYGEQDGQCYFLSPALEGATLLALMRQRKRWTPQEVLYLLTPIANAFEYLHRQERAWQFFNPANVIILKDTTLSIEPVQLTGLGLLSILRLQGLEEIKADIATCAHLRSIAGTYPGAPEYLAPEVVKGGQWDARSDIYALGILLFSLLSGGPPFDGESYLETAHKHVYEVLPSLYERAPDLPAALELVVNRALQRRPDFRYQRPGELVAAYLHIVKERLQQPEHLDLSRRLLGLPLLPTPVFADRFRLPAGVTPNIISAVGEMSDSEQEASDDEMLEITRRPALPRVNETVAQEQECFLQGTVQRPALRVASSRAGASVEENSLASDDETTKMPVPLQAKKSGVQRNVQQLLTSLREISLFSRAQGHADGGEARDDKEGRAVSLAKQVDAPSNVLLPGLPARGDPEVADPQHEERACAEKEPVRQADQATQSIGKIAAQTTGGKGGAESPALAQDNRPVIRSDLNTDIAAMGSYLQQLKERLKSQMKQTGTQPRRSAEPEQPDGAAPAAVHNEEEAPHSARNAAPPVQIDNTANVASATRSSGREEEDPFPEWLA